MTSADGFLFHEGRVLGANIVRATQFRYPAGHVHRQQTRYCANAERANVLANSEEKSVVNL